MQIANIKNQNDSSKCKINQAAKVDFTNHPIFNFALRKATWLPHNFTL